MLVYGPGMPAPERTIKQGVKGAVALALDSAGNLYVANFFVNQKSAQRGFVAVYPPGAEKPGYELGRSGSDQFFMALDGQNDLYLGHRGASSEAVTVYPPGSSKPIQTITRGIGGLEGLAISPG